MEIDISSEVGRFQSFISEENNDNIIFSGVFGTGKSYFIDKFFNTHHLDKYLEIHITPVNYSVSNNEDIFEYIKLNILFELLEKTSYKLEKTNISFSNGAYYYLKDHSDSLIQSIASLIEKISFKTNVIDQLVKLKHNIDEYIKYAEIDENEIIKDLVALISNQKGSIYENDIITQLIRSMVNDYKIKNTNKKVVLVIDDLDRIDPEHIFRILNILSAHNDFCGDNHKFEIDKTILVCDIENIRQIFHAHHGLNVDFTGYIDKFYSREIFNFNNIKNIIFSIEDLFNSVYINKHNVHTLYSSEWREVFNSILKLMIDKNLINLRSLLKVENKKIEADRFIYLDNRTLRSFDCPGIFFFDLLRIFFPTISLMEKAINVLDFGSVNSDEYIVSVLILLADYRTHFSDNGVYNYEGCDYIIEHGTIKYYMGTIKTQDKIISQNKLIKDAFLNYKNYFK